MLFYQQQTALLLSIKGIHGRKQARALNVKLLPFSTPARADLRRQFLDWIVESGVGRAGFRRLPLSPRKQCDI
jgi:hypothetical protein